MEINKVNFESFKTDEITKSFEDLDVNGDGRITNADLSATQDSAIKSQILSILNDVDDEPVVEKAGKKKNTTSTYECVNEINAADIDTNITNSQGVVYLVMGNPPQCGRCVNLDNAIRGRQSELEAKAKVYSMNSSANNSKFWELCSKFTNKSSVGLPIVIKFVNGQPVEMVSEGTGSADWIVQKMIDGATTTTGTTGTAGTTEATGTTGTTGTTDTTTAAGAAATDATTTTTTTTTTAKTEADITKAAEDLLAKYPPAEATGEYDIYSTANPEVMALKQALEGGAIEDLSAQGFTRDNIIAIISKAYPNTGIKANDKGGYDCPYGHGDATTIYDMFVDKMSQVSSSAKTELLAQVAELNEEINANNLKLNTLKGAISTIQSEIEELIEDAIAKSEEIQEDQKEASALIVKEELNKYTSGKGSITYDDFQNNVSDRLDTLAGSANSKLSSVVLKLINAEGKMGILKGYIDSFQTYVDANKTLADKVSELEKSAATATDCEAEDVSSRCDPIGFTVNGVRYDFFVDKDSDGKLSNENEFLGATDGWAEMAALDTDGDGKVTASELGDLKIVTTDEDCNHGIKNASEVLGDNDYIDLNSYKAQNQDFSNGNTLLGTYSLNIDGKEVTDGYNTMDKISWLDVNYEFSDKEKGINRFAKDNTETADIVDYSTELVDFNAKYTELGNNISEAWKKVGITRVDVSETIQKAEADSTKVNAEELEEKLKNKCGITKDEDS